MTETEWIDCTDLSKMVLYLERRVSNRKLRLFACACCRRLWDLLPDEQTRTAVVLNERFADGWCAPEKLQTAASVARNVAVDRLKAGYHGNIQMSEGLAACAVNFAAHGNHLLAAQFAASARATLSERDRQRFGYAAERGAQVHLLRDIAGHPPHQVHIPESWISWNEATPRKIAQALYDHRILPTGRLDIALLAVMADALEEAGCSDKQVLAHLRAGGEHYRGCWVVDALLDKK